MILAGGSAAEASYRILLIDIHIHIRTQMLHLVELGTDNVLLRLFFLRFLPATALCRGVRRYYELPHPRRGALSRHSGIRA